MSVYTKTGDKGRTSFYAGKRVSKANIRVEAYGTVDELNSAIGIAISKIKDQRSKRKLESIQNDLFEIGAALANPHSTSSRQATKLNLEKRVKEFEEQVDVLEKKLPQLNNFILPGGSFRGSLLHFARTVSRRAERRIIQLSEVERVQDEIIVYMNRLSDLLFMFARFINYKEKKKEILWSKR